MARNGKIEGEYLSYYANGSLRRKGQYKNGQMYGTWHDFTPEGQESVYKY